MVFWLVTKYKSLNNFVTVFWFEQIYFMKIVADVYRIQYGFCNLEKMFLTLKKIAVAFHVTTELKMTECKTVLWEYEYGTARLPQV